MPTPVNVGPVRFGASDLAWILGPCVIESLDLCRQVAERLKATGLPFVFKASFDKANRSSRGAVRGPGLDEGLKVLETIRREFRVPVTTDIHETTQAAEVAEVVDLLQIPAFLCRQTDLLLAAAETGKPVNVKKGQFLAPWDMKNVIGKLDGAAGVLLTERGSTFGYNNLVVDMRGIDVMRELGAPVVFDATHSVQRPGGLGAATGGDRRFVAVLSRAAAAAGVDAFFMETHPDPDRAPCDGPNMIPLDELPALARRLIRIRQAASEA
ncbi:MAG TPA: 3-deoxy-8-phosphooctulonate synthase [Candidatus Brocadiia bacterium]|nr:3-deoxy-8-phosphooctulonate synthase [Candidatus Brocadiia bacterium]